MTDLPPPVWLARELDPTPLAGFPHLDGLGCARFHRGQSAREPHRHRGIEIHFVWRGHYHWTVEGTTFTACAGDAFVTCPWHLHGSPSGTQEPGWYSWAIIAPERFARGGALRLGRWSWLGAELAASVGRQLAGAHLLPKAAEVGAAMHRLAGEFAARPEGWQVRADALLADLLLVTARAAGSARARAEDPLASGLAAAVRAELARPWPLPALCRESGLAPATLRRHLVAASGLSPRDFVAAQRIAAAEERLRAGEDLAAVAFACGFASQQHLTTRFRLATGYTPGEYRAAWR
ncbi:MAG: AraC family transcriptional regulator [Planctomycetes bacterium]|nr:AraC family transcriptional regulator [Planctomycetota bacterium]